MSFENPVLRMEPEWDEIAGLLLKEQCSCVISHVEKGIRFYWERGVRDLYRLVSEEPEMLAGALVADKVVGKGAAALLACGKVSGVYAPVMSTPARELLEQNGVEVRCKQEVDHIENRSKTDWCPVEKLCRNLNTPEMCVKEIAKFIASQGQNK